MTDHSGLTAIDILAIPASDPEKLFSGPSAVKEEYHALAMRWHPDTSDEKRCDEVFNHIVTLHRAAEKKKTAGHWEYPGRLTIEGRGSKYDMRYAKKHTFEYGDAYIGRTQMAFSFKREFDDLVDNTVRTIRTFPFASPGMLKEISRYLPPARPIFIETDDRRYLVFEKTEELILLRDLLEHQGGKIDPKHVAWIMSSLYNLACYLQYARLTHNDISLDTYLISPTYHSGVLLGGWWFSAKTASKMVALPSRSLALAPPDVLASKVASSRLDLALIRQLGRDLLGDIKNAPEPMRKWLSYASDGNAVRDYEEWKKVLTDSFGARRFVELKVSASDVY